MRKIVNSDPSRLDVVKSLMEKHPRLIVFYNFNYELDALRTLGGDGISIAEWNGHRHEEIPNTDRWVYLVQYVAGAEGWNCIATDAVCFYSLTYSYKNFMQAQGRIDRLNTSFLKLFYYVLLSKSQIDQAVSKTLDGKQLFNERAWAAEALGISKDFGHSGE
jgi:superfamily II DNA or RNA helicase